MKMKNMTDIPAQLRVLAKTKITDRIRWKCIKQYNNFFETTQFVSVVEG